MAARPMLKIALMVFSAVTFVVLGDAAGKTLTSGGVNPLTVAWSRFLIAAVLILPFSGIRLSELRAFTDWRVILRGVLITGGISSMLTALKTEPIANVFGAFFIGPVVSYLLAIVFLREQSSWSRTVLLVIGFVGVMLVVKPGFGVSVGIGFALLGGVFYGGYLAITKLVVSSYRPRFLLLSQLIVGSCILTPVGISNGIPELSLVTSLLFLASVCASAAGNYLLVISNRIADASLIAPLVYSQLISATVVGVLIFNDWPDLYSLLGLSLIVLSGFGSIVIANLNIK